MRTGALAGILAAILGLGASGATVRAAESYPSKPVRLVVPFAPGGGTDIIARLIGQSLGESWGQTVVVDNRTGAGGVIGVALVAKSNPDGYTMLLASNGPLTYLPALNSNLPYDPAKAKALLAEAGYPDGVDSVLYTPTGRYLNDRQVAEAVQAQARAVGIRLIAAIAQTKATIAEKGLQIEQIKTEFTQRALDELQRTRQTLAEATQQKVAAEDRLNRTIIRAPQAGIVHESIVHTVGGVVGSGQTLMMIVPQSDDLLVGIHIDPMDIDQIQTGQRVHLRFSSLDQRKTPEAWGGIEKVSPDLVVEQQTGRRYYTANVRIEAEEKAKLPANIKLLPGMPVEAFVTTGERSVLDYLLHPFVAELQLAFREP